MNVKFNGDLFPGKGRSKREREREWRQEMDQVEPRHLETLANFVGGRFRGQQGVLWRQYSFDVIPLDFVSSIYEEFVTTDDAHSTPGFLVDFMLDGVLPWDGDEWDLKVLDPACGSGIFLVKAYERLIQRWKNAHGGQRAPTPILKRLLEKNLFGVDVNPHAVRVASFSLYLTMCDEIDPKTYLRTTKFPRLRDHRLIHADFFEEKREGFRSERTGPVYDLVVGNAPWGRNTETPYARTWASPPRSWPIPNKAIGTLFLAKSASLTKPEGRVCMIQPASSLLFNRSGPANRFRQRFFSEFKVEEVVNLSTLRFELFENATSPPCIVTLRPTKPDDEPIVYISPKQVRVSATRDAADSKYSVIVEPHDVSRVWPEEAASEPFVWTALAWGGRRDLALVRRLRRMDSLLKLEKKGHLWRRKGIVRGDQRKRLPAIGGRRVLEASAFPEGTFLFLDANQLPENENEFVDGDDSVTTEPFDLPQLVLKKSWQSETGRVRASLIVGNPAVGGVVCSQSYVSAHTRPEYGHYLHAACLTYNSAVAVYFLLLTSGRLASYRPEPLVEEVLSLPIPEPEKDLLAGIRGLDELDGRTRKAFGFKDAEWVLIEDLFNYTMRDFGGKGLTAGLLPTERRQLGQHGPQREPQLSEYCRYFVRVLKAGFGEDKRISATIFQEVRRPTLPVRLVAIHLDWLKRKSVSVERIDSAELCSRLVELDDKLLKAGDSQHGGVFFRRVARVYDECEHGGRAIPTIYIVKPDQIRYWTRSAALRDADEVAADIVLWKDRSVAAARPEAGGNETRNVP